MFPPFALLPPSCFSLFCDSRFHFSALAISPFIFAYKEHTVVKKQLKALITNTELLFSTFFVECFEVCSSRFEKGKTEPTKWCRCFFKSIIMKSPVYRFRICGFFLGCEWLLWESLLRRLESILNIFSTFV